MPAEWSPHLATWLSWPHNADTWPGVLEAAEAAMVSVVAALARHEEVFINVQDAAAASRVRDLLSGSVPMERVHLELIPTDDAWIRDYGAITVHDDGSEGGMSAVDFGYNAWGGKYPPFDRDCAVAARMAGRLGLPVIAGGMVLEGGSVDVNGEGLGLVTEQCLLNPNRNPSMQPEEISIRLRELLGLDELIWLGEGIEGDDTDGHIDNLARFVAPRRVAAVVVADRADSHHEPLAENRRRLADFRDSDGRALEIVELPLPAPVVRGGVRLPASYANFYVANGVVLVPSYSCPEDVTASGILAECFPGREIVSVDCRALIVGLGALHCLTQQVPVIVPGPERQQEQESG